MSIDRDRPDVPRWVPQATPVASDAVRRQSSQAASAEQARFERAMQRANSQDSARVRADSKSSSPLNASLNTAGPGASRVPVRDPGFGSRDTSSRRQQNEARSSSVLQARERQDRQTSAVDDNGESLSMDEQDVTSGNAEAVAAPINVAAGSQQGEQGGSSEGDGDSSHQGVGAVGAVSIAVNATIAETASIPGSVSSVQDVAQVLDELQSRAARGAGEQVFELNVDDPDIASLRLSHDPARGWRIDVQARSGGSGQQESSHWSAASLHDALHARGHRIDQIVMHSEGAL